VIAQFIFDEGKVDFTTFDVTVHRNPKSEYSLSPCYNEEFDTRVLLHGANAPSQGYKCIPIIANNTEVVVLAISFFSDWFREIMGYIKGQKDKIYCIHGIFSAMSPASMLIQDFTPY